LMANVHWHSQDRSVFQDDDLLGHFEEERYQAKVGLQRLLGNWGSARFGYGYERIVIPTDDLLFGGVSDDGSHLWVDLLVDTRDKSFLTQHGSSASLDVKRVLSPSRATHWLASGSHFVTPRKDWTLGLKGAWGTVSSGAPGYDHISVGGAGYFSTGSVDFAGTQRDAFRTRHLALGGVLIRKSFGEPFVEALRDFAVGGFYQAGRVDAPSGSNSGYAWVHGLGVGLYLDRRFTGPIRFEVTGSNHDPLLVFASVGYAF
ncbi:MAG: hypothetical protein O3B73_15265, partial [bacterium]|nr:hypothetical protein [bacterium]